ncbi:hypothetical protein K8I28_12905 [bacterium]|nr:hypothetical protein [bacterium]
MPKIFFFPLLFLLVIHIGCSEEDNPVAEKPEPEPTLYITTDSLEFGTTESEYYFELRNLTDTSISLELRSSDNWITVSPESLQLNSYGQVELVTRLERFSCEPGSYQGWIQILSDQEIMKTLPVTMTVEKQIPRILFKSDNVLLKSDDFFVSSSFKLTYDGNIAIDGSVSRFSEEFAPEFIFTSEEEYQKFRLGEEFNEILQHTFEQSGRFHINFPFTGSFEPDKRYRVIVDYSDLGFERNEGNIVVRYLLLEICTILDPLGVVDDPNGELINHTDE